MPRTILCLALMATAIVPVVSGCEEQIRSERSPAFGPAFGNAVENNRAAQIINPIPPVATAAPDFNGKRAESAIERYRTGTVILPTSTGISTVVGGGASSPGGGGGAPAGGGGAPSQ